MSNFSRKFVAIPGAAVVATMASVAIAEPVLVSQLDTPVIQNFNGNLDVSANDPAFLRGSLAGDAATLTTTTNTAAALSGLGITSTIDGGPLTRISDTGFINGSNVDFHRIGNRLENNPVGRAASIFQVTVANETEVTVNEATVSFDFSIIDRGGDPGVSTHSELLGIEGYFSVDEGATWTHIAGLGGEAIGTHTATFPVGDLFFFDNLLLRFVDDNGSGSSSYNINNTQPGEGAYGFDNFSISLSATSEPTGDADFDGDGDVDGADFLTWQRNLGAAGGQELGDADGNGQIEGADLTVWESQFGPGAATAVAAAVPEPGALGMALVAASVAAARRRANCGRLTK